jgi:SAM-dependent methyltransferase
MPLWLAVILLVTGFLFAVKLTYVAGTVLVLPATRGALYVSTPRRRIAAILRTTGLQPGQLLVDLGCGDGRVLRLAHQCYGARAIGYELNPLAYAKAWLQCLGLSGISIRRCNFMTANLSAADVVFCYLFPDVMAELAAKLTAELKPGAVILSCNFALPGFIPMQVIRPGNLWGNDPVYIYRMAEPG